MRMRFSKRQIKSSFTLLLVVLFFSIISTNQAVAYEEYCFFDLDRKENCTDDFEACMSVRKSYIENTANNDYRLNTASNLSLMKSIIESEIEGKVYVCQPKEIEPTPIEYWCYYKNDFTKCVQNKVECEKKAVEAGSGSCFESPEDVTSSGDETPNTNTNTDTNKPPNPTATQIKESPAVYGDQETNPTKPGWRSLVWGCAGGKIAGQGGCTFNDAIYQVQKLINFGFFMVIVILPLLLTWAGFIYISASWNGDKKLAEAKAIFTNTIKAYIVAAAAWAIVRFILDALVTSEFIQEANKFIQ